MTRKRNKSSLPNMRESAVVWFRLDLRLSDNPALTAAARSGRHVVPVFIWAPEEEGDWAPGAASRWWLHQSLKSLDDSLKLRGLRLILRQGPSLNAIQSLVRECGADSVFWNQCYEPSLRARDAHIRQSLLSEGLCIETFDSALLCKPDSVKNTKGNPFLLFTPFWRACQTAIPDSPPVPPPKLAKFKLPSSGVLKEFNLEPAVDWAAGLRCAWQPGESGAQRNLSQFLDEALENYPEMRNYPAHRGTSRLSPHLRFGEISPRQVWAACINRVSEASRAFLRQLGWREFAYHLLFHFPETTLNPLRPQFSRFPWQQDPQKLRAWQMGRTGYPLVDAGMRELWKTGWMHNRLRMIVGSFLVKDLLLPWTEGARWFWDTLVDADLANNTLGWQWIAGCGADAAPYFRIFNPDSQAGKFDPKGEYVSRWVPESHGADYPRQIVNHAQARERALDVFAAINRRQPVNKID
jgi:deoxyribodipyrimidine photo-lyase